MAARKMTRAEWVETILFEEHLRSRGIDPDNPNHLKELHRQEQGYNRAMEQENSKKTE